MPCQLADLLKGLTGQRVDFREVEVSGVTCDSRQVVPGSVFVAVTGTKVDGHAFVDEAIRRGCAAVVVEKPFVPAPPLPVVVVRDARAALADLAVRYYGDPTSRINVVGITGTKGKSTTAVLLHRIFEAAGGHAGLLGTIRYELGRRSLPAKETTPGSDDLQRYFAEMAQAGCTSAAMEVSSHALVQQRVRGVRFAAGLFTNLTRDHLDYHETMENYRDAKALLFEGLSKRSLAVLNGDDPSSVHLAERTTARVIRFGFGAGYPVSAGPPKTTFQGTAFSLRLGDETLSIRSSLIGTHNVYNMMAAAGCAWAMGYDLEPIKAGLEGIEGISGRLERVDGGQEFGLFVDYAHTEDALRNVLGCLRPLTRGRLILVFGCGGDRDRGKRPQMGKAAEDLADFFILTSDNPRGENSIDIIREIEKGVTSRSKYLIEPDRRSAIKLAISLAHKEDLVLIAGKGHETVQIFREGTVPFDDRRIALEIVNEMARKV